MKPEAGQAKWARKELLWRQKEMRLLAEEPAKEPKEAPEEAP